MMKNGKEKLVCIARLSGKQDGKKEREMKACVFSCFVWDMYTETQVPPEGKVIG